MCGQQLLLFTQINQGWDTSLHTTVTLYRMFYKITQFLIQCLAQIALHLPYPGLLTNYLQLSCFLSVNKARQDLYSYTYTIS